MKICEVSYPEDFALELKDFRDMDYYAVENYHLPIELMMENAGLQLANLIANYSKKENTIKIGIGNGNNGGGGLVAARILAAWGYTVYLDLFTEITKELPQLQLKRAIAFGAKMEDIDNPTIWVDAYLGFSQHLPLKESLISRIEKANKSNAIRIALDIPTGFLGNTDTIFFKSDKIITLAASKKILYKLDARTEIFIADLGIPEKVYKKFKIEMPPFTKGNSIKIKRV